MPAFLNVPFDNNEKIAKPILNDIQEGISVSSVSLTYIPQLIWCHLYASNIDEMSLYLPGKEQFSS